MSLWIRSMRKSSTKIQNKYWDVTIDLASVGFSDSGVITYLLVKKSRYTCFTQTSTYKELCGVNRNKLFWYANLMAQNAISTSTSKQIVLSYVEQAFSFMNDTALVGPAGDSHSDKMTFLEATYPEQYKRLELSLDGCGSYDGSPYDPLAWNDVCNVNGVAPNDKGRMDGRDLMKNIWLLGLTTKNVWQV